MSDQLEYTETFIREHCVQHGLPLVDWLDQLYELWELPESLGDAVPVWMVDPEQAPIPDPGPDETVLVLLGLGALAVAGVIVIGSWLVAPVVAGLLR